MYRIHEHDDREKWKLACPDPKRHRNWRVADGVFECRQCGETYGYLIDLKTGEQVRREQVEIIGADADHKGKFGEPTV